MVLDDNDLNDILTKLAKKIGVKFDEKITIGEIMKKVVNQNLCYQNETQEINILKPGFKNGFFIKNGDFKYDKNPTADFDHDHVIGAKFLSNKIIQLVDVNGKKIRVEHDPEAQTGVYVSLKEMPLCAYMKLIS